MLTASCLVLGRAHGRQWLSVVAWENGIVTDALRDAKMDLCIVKRRDLCVCP